MKKALILTSVIALAACSTGGGDGIGGGHEHGAPGTPNPSSGVVIQSFAEGQGDVNQSNTSLTGMSSYTTNYTGDTSVEAEMAAYVEGRINGARGGILNTRAASNRVTRDAPLVTDADAAITSMKQVLYDMAHISGRALSTYVSNHKADVYQAFVLWADDPTALTVTADSSVQELINAFGNFGLTADNVMNKLDNFDAENFHFTKQRLTDVKLNDSGTDAHFRFKLDDSGKITGVSLWESVTGEYNSQYADTRIILNGNSAVADTGNGSNPFDEDYLNGTAGWLTRGTGNNDTQFTGKVYAYTFAFGARPTGANALAHNYADDDFTIYSNKKLSLAEAKEMLRNKIIEKVNKTLHQQDSAESPEVVNSFVATANWYLSQINGFSSLVNPVEISQVASMTGVGRELNLKYSDFGYSTLTRTIGNESETQFVTYTGGYDERRMDNRPAHNDLENGATFNGTAIVSVENHTKDKTTGLETNTNALYRDDEATLTYTFAGDVATHTLTMENLTAQAGGDVEAGTDWYTTVVTGTTGAPENGDNIVNFYFNDDGKDIADAHQFFGDGIVNTNGNIADPATANAIDSVNGNTPNNNYSLQGSMSAEYYADENNNPAEATSGFYVAEHYHSTDNNVQHELSVYGAFGGNNQ